MSKKPHILAFGGSLRRASFNQKLAAIAARGASDAGADVTVIALRGFDLPIFNEDDEAANGMPADAKRLKQLFLEADGLIIASPEYNSSVSAALKNAIDWVSRATEPNESPLAALAGKTAVICSTSPGGLGGIRGLVHLRDILGNIAINVLHDQVAIPSAHTMIDASGNIQDSKLNAKVTALGATLANHLKKHLA
jgi:NAD(P)H-dependent FMN reductase